MKKWLADWEKEGFVEVSEDLATLAPGAKRDNAVIVFSRWVSAKDPDSARAWAESISDRELRTGGPAALVLVARQGSLYLGARSL